MKLNRDFQGGGGGAKQKNLPWGEYGILNLFSSTVEPG